MVGIEPAHLVGTGGAVGALLRHALARRFNTETFPAGTVLVNVLGSFGLGIVAFGGAGSDAVLLVGVGACGSFTTFSTFSFDTVRLVETGRLRRAALNALGTLVLSLAAVGFAAVLVGQA